MIAKPKQKSYPTALTLLPVLNFQERPKGVGNFTGIGFGNFYDREFPVDAGKAPIFTTWKEVSKRFDLTVKLIDPNGKLVSMHTETVEPSNEWGYKWHIFSFDLSPAVEGFYTLELYADNQFQLSRLLEFFKTTTDRKYPIKNSPRLTSCFVAQAVSELGNTFEVDVKNIMSDKGCRLGGALSIVSGWVDCYKAFKLRYELINPKGFVINKLTFDMPARTTVPTTLSHTHSMANLELHGYPFRDTGVYTVRIHYPNAAQTVPFLLCK